MRVCNKLNVSLCDIWCNPLISGGEPTPPVANYARYQNIPQSKFKYYLEGAKGAKSKLTIW